MDKRVTSYIIFGFSKSDLTHNDWDRVKDSIPWADMHNLNNEVYIGPAISKIEGIGINEKIDVRFDTLAYIRRIFQEGVLKSSGVWIPDSLFHIIHITIEEFV